MSKKKVPRNKKSVATKKKTTKRPAVKSAKKSSRHRSSGTSVHPRKPFPSLSKRPGPKPKT